ncbi:hypothetical protein [Sphingomonas pokkalii]|uniref:Transcriptional regulator n=1 Tax=Sphingomonas pokkalii TaxID=2175090 RepID=A0A2U0SGK2_9SPHN|nr:hypothetical protein [Sphingomonas pokkalii]PVX30424.1 hypothetical protein DD559_14615 [Sphingomonas pokkalii]
MSVHQEIEAFLQRTRMPAARFGRLAAGDPRLVYDLRLGRAPGPALSARLRAFIAAQGASRRAPQ